MKVDIKIDPTLKEPFIQIHTNEISDEITSIVNMLNKPMDKTISCTSNEKIYFLNSEDINFFYSENKKIFVNSEKGVLEVKYKLYELEERFGHLSFMRISKSCIANLNKINNLEISFGGTMTVIFNNGSKEYISRRYVMKIKQFLNIGGI